MGYEEVFEHQFELAMDRDLHGFSNLHRFVGTGPHGYGYRSAD